MRTPVCLVCGLVVAAGAGCGGDAGVVEAPAPLRKAAEPKTLPAGQAPATSRSEEAAIQQALERDRLARRRREAAADARRRRESLELAAREHERSADRVATEILHAAGFEASNVMIEDRGRTARLAVTRDSACETRPGVDERSLSKQLRAALPFLRRVTVTVQGSSGSLTKVRETCGPELEAQKGEVFVQQRGTGAFRSRLVDITAKRWSIDYASDGSFIDIVVLKDGRELRSTISGTAGATGTRSFDGVGTFRIRVAGDGRWAVRVRGG